MRKLKTIILILIIINSTTAVAEPDELSLCKPLSEIAPTRPDLPPPIEDFIRLSSENAVVHEKLGTSTFSGNVFVQRGEQILSTPHVTYDRQKEIIDADKDFLFWDSDYVIKGTSAQLRSNNKGDMKDVEYWFLKRRARGQADKLTKDSKDIIHLEQASYTTCQPEHEFWRLDTESMTLNNATAQGTARNVKLRILDVPVFYFPYLWFPLGNERQSGFLAPNLGSSDEAGFEFSIPYYLNLAPNYDATLTPRLMSRRGLLLGGEFRYLTQASGGELKLEYLPYDNSFREERSSLAFKHNGLIGKRWLTSIDLNYVSDRRYFEELGNNISVASITHLERRGDLTYFGNGWGFLGRLQTFQTLDTNPAARPYQRLPQLLFKTYLPEFNRRFNVGMKAEWVRFDRDISYVDGPIGNRLDVGPVVSYPWRTPGTFVVPKLSLRYTHYDLDNVNADDETTHNRFLYTFSTDSGLFFERDINWLNTSLVQTLEPRLYYRYTPYEDQANLPLFDTAEYDLSFLQLFRENRFSGTDRIDDGHQLTFGLSSRLLGSTTGAEHLRASIGEIFYFRDRQVTLPGQTEETDASSSIITELAAQFADSWQTSSTVRWNPYDQNMEHSVLRLRYRPENERIFNISYRRREESIEQTDLSFYWRLGRRWKILGRWNYSLPSEKTLEAVGGLEYSTCCWAMRAITRRYLNNIDGFGYLNGFFLQFQLTGLGNIGKAADSFLEQRIPGYYDQF